MCSENGNLIKCAAALSETGLLFGKNRFNNRFDPVIDEAFLEFKSYTQEADRSVTLVGVIRGFVGLEDSYDFCRFPHFLELFGADTLSEE